jgi:hypothetical protein
MLFNLVRPRNRHWQQPPATLHFTQASRRTPFVFYWHLLLFAFCPSRLCSPAACRIVSEEKGCDLWSFQHWRRYAFRCITLRLDSIMGHKGLFEDESVRQSVIQLRRVTPIHPVITPSNHKWNSSNRKALSLILIMNTSSLPSETRLFALASLEPI